VTLQVHLVDGTFELFRSYHSPRTNDPVRGAARGAVAAVLGLLEGGATHVGVATDHVIESFRNDLWPAYKSSAGLPRALLEQFEPLEEALAALGVVVWRMVELEADDALAAAARVAAADPEVERVVIVTPDKDLGQCVVGERVVQWDRMRQVVRDEAGVRAKFGVAPASIPDWLALVGDSADGYPGLPGFGAKTAAALLARWERIDAIPPDPRDWQVAVRGAPVLAAVLATNAEAAMLFRVLATLVADADLAATVADLRWPGPTTDFPAAAAALGDPGLAVRARRLADRPEAL
jgi:5'-3' exonuclease